MNYKDLLAAVDADATARDADVTLLPSQTDTSLKAQYRDEMGTINYYVPSTDLMMFQIENEVDGSDITDVDAFWFILNSLYKI